MKIVLGRPRDEQKHEAILHAAKSLFLEFGYDGSSMDKIAKHAGVTKITIYNHFRDKETLFTAAITKYCADALPQQSFILTLEHDFLQALRHVGLLTLHTIYRPEAMKLHVLLLQLSQTNPELARRFYDASHLKLQIYLQEFFQQAYQLGYLTHANSHQICQVFLSLLIGSYYNQVLLHVQPVPDEQGLEELLAQAVQVIVSVFQSH